MREVYRKRVETLLEALPYIRLFSGKTVVIKYGGAAMESADLKEEFATDIVLLRHVGIRPIIVHGGGAEVTAYMKRLDLPVRFVDGLRVTDEAAMEVTKMVLVGKVNKEIVSLINHKGVPAVGLCGDDGRLMTARRLVAPVRRMARSSTWVWWARSRRVNTDLLNLLEADYVPVVASVGVGEDGEQLQHQRRHGGGRLGGRAAGREAHLPHRCGRSLCRLRGRVQPHLRLHVGSHPGARRRPARSPAA